MTGIRKYRRAKASAQARASNARKARRKLLLREYLLVGGLVMLGFGAFYGAHEYDVYRMGRPERLVNSRFGTWFVDVVPADEPDRPAAAIGGFAVAGVGGAVLVFSLALWAIDWYVARERAGEGPDYLNGT